MTLLEALLSKGDTPAVSFDATLSLEAFLSLQDALTKSDWNTVGNSAIQMIESAFGSLDGALARSDKHELLGPVFASGFVATFVSHFVQHADFEVALSEFEQSADLNTPFDQEARADVAERLRAVARGDIDPFDRVREEISEFTGSPISHGALSILARGLLGLAHHAFNRSLSNPVPPFVPIVAQVDACEALIDQKSAALTEHISNLQAACSAKQPESVAFAALMLRQFCHREIPQLARVLAACWRLADALAFSGSGSAAEGCGDLGARGHLVLREMIAFTISGYRLAGVAGGLPDTEQIQSLYESAGSLPLDGTMPNGVNRAIHNLAAGDDDTFVEILGRIMDLSSRIDDEDRLIGRIDLTDLSSGAEVTAFGFFLNPVSVGMTKNAFVRLSGTFHTKLDLNDGLPGIIVDRLPLAELANGQWRAGLVRGAMPFFPVYRNSHNTRWTFGPHLQTQGSFDPATAGASELNFLRFGIPEEDESRDDG
ncbi:hypothetical protein [Ruegeria atlantica]|uniref:hypothetical protein n=1 Tax=Ruegeria atlantica TaxID=81569 RepID=UPI001480EB62|nr:hypothetical protein [Ruegeria atlantica]